MEVSRPTSPVESTVVIVLLPEVQAESSQSTNFRSLLVTSRYEILQSVEDKQ